MSTMLDDNGQGSSAPLAALGPALRRAWLGYQRRLDEEIAAAGFTDRKFPNGRVLRLCAKADTTIAQIGRELGVTRQRAAQIVSALRDAGYVTVTASPVSGKEKVVTPTDRAVAYLRAHRTAADKISRAIEDQLGQDAVMALRQLLDHLADGEDIRLRDYLRQKRQDGGPRYPEE